MGTPIVQTQGECTAKQLAFLNMASVEYTNDERDFWIKLFGGKPTRHDSSIRDHGLRNLKDPYSMQPK